MALKLYYHPLASFCHKALLALYESDISFEPVLVDFYDEKSSAALRSLWPIAKFPVLRDEARNQTVPEATVIIEYLDTFYGTHLVPADADARWQARLWDRFYDLYVHAPMQQIVANNLRPEGAKDPFGVEQAKAQLSKSYEMIEREMDGRIWARGETFTMADCAAAPALFFAEYVAPIGAGQHNLRGYRERMIARPSFARALKEAEPYFNMVPLDNKPTLATENA